MISFQTVYLFLALAGDFQGGALWPLGLGFLFLGLLFLRRAFCCLGVSGKSFWRCLLQAERKRGHMPLADHRPQGPMKILHKPARGAGTAAGNLRRAV